MIPLKNTTIDHKINTTERRDLSGKLFDVVTEKRTTSEVRMQPITITIGTTDNGSLGEIKSKGYDRLLAHDFDDDF